MTSTYPLRDLTCGTCGRSFRKAHGRICGPCAHDRAKKPCGAGCGRRIAKKSDRCRYCRVKPTGKDNAHWRGGRYKDNGYWRVKADGHPRASKGGYVPEHIIVMEATLGRYLLPGENVHHRNGVRDDNRPENLELWAVAQPAGQRAVDLLAWARMIEARYGPVEAML